MVISVQFCGVQRTHTQTHEIEMSIVEHGKVGDVFKLVRNSYPNLPLDKNDILVTVNNTVATMNHNLNPNDKVVFLPHIGGG